MYGFDYTGCQLEPIVLYVSVASLVAPFDPIDLFHLVVVIEAHDDFADDHVEARTQTTARHDCHFRLSRITEQGFARTSFDKLD